MFIDFIFNSVCLYIYSGCRNEHFHGKRTKFIPEIDTNNYLFKQSWLNKTASCLNVDVKMLSDSISDKVEEKCEKVKILIYHNLYLKNELMKNVI